MKLLRINLSVCLLLLACNANAGISLNHSMIVEATILSQTDKNVIISNGIDEFYIPKKFLKLKSIDVQKSTKSLKLELMPHELEALIMVNNHKRKLGGSGGTGGGR